MKHTITIVSMLLALVSFSQKVSIGSKEYAESRLLGEMMAQVIESRTELKVERRLGLGGTLICFEALKSGEIDVYPEFTGTGKLVILDQETDIRDPQVLYDDVQQQFNEKYDIEWLKPLGFQNVYALVGKKDIGVDNLTELAETEGLRFGFSNEFMKRRDGYPGLKKHYGFDFDNVRGMEHGLVYRALENDEIDITDAYSTDGKLKAYDLKLLEDDRDFFPPYYAAPLVRTDALKKFPGLRDALNSLAGKLDEETMRRLNYRTEVEHDSFAAVASDFLLEEGIIDERTVASGFWSSLWEKIVEHIALTFMAVALAILLGVPLGMLISYRKKLASTVLTISGVIQTIPSLALLGFMIPLLGIGFWPAMVALFLYALLPIVRNTYSGLEGIDPELLEAARAMGMKQNQVLWKLKLPLSVRIIMAGVRTATVINIGTATLAAFIGAGGLGEFIITGITLNSNDLILQGAIPAALLALVVDYLMGHLENLLEPKGLKIARNA